MDITLEESVEELNESLMYEAEQHGVSVGEIQEAFRKPGGINNLDGVFGDGGEVRCESYADLAWEYALQFGEFGGEAFDEALSDVYVKAMEQFGKY